MTITHDWFQTESAWESASRVPDELIGPKHKKPLCDEYEMKTLIADMIRCAKQSGETWGIGEVQHVPIGAEDTIIARPYLMPPAVLRRHTGYVYAIAGADGERHDVFGRMGGS